MSGATEALRYAYTIILGDHSRGCVLLLSDPLGWRLPQFTLDERQVWQEVGPVNRWLHEDLHAPALALRCMALDYNPTTEVVSLYYAASLRDPSWMPQTDARWVTAGELSALDRADPAQRDQIAAWFAWYAADSQATQRVAWYQPGWYDRMLTWACAALNQAGLRLTGPAEQIRSWQRAAILRLPTATGPVYCKAVPPVFGHEPALTAALAAAAPQRIATPIAVEPTQGWLLMHALPGQTLAHLRDDHDLPHWEAALAAFAELQIVATATVPTLTALGVPERPLTTLSARLQPLLADPDATLPNRPAGLSAQNRAQLVAYASRVAPKVDALASYGLPATLEHGDFWPGQVIVGPHGAGFLDWSDSTIAHPFFSLLLFLIEIEDFFPRIPGVRERLRDAYLEPWAAVVPGVALAPAFEVAQPLAALHHALSYYTVVLPALEVRWELELMLPFYLKMALRLALTD